MNLRLVPVAVITAFSTMPALATGSLDFKAGDYYLSVAVSLDSHSAVGPIRFASPRFKPPFLLQQTQFKVLLCNTKSQRFTAEFVNPGNPELPDSFKLSVHGTKGQLFINGKRISFVADWLVQ